MNKVTTVNLGGSAYQLEEAGYDALRTYLETASSRLQGNPDRDEILSDIERAIADKFRAILGGYKNVVETREVEAVLKEMGQIEADTDAEPAGAGAPGAAGSRRTNGEESSGAAKSAPRRLYRIGEGAMLAGVCNGIAAYFDVDPTLVRLSFVFLTIFWGSGVLLYIILALVIPEAHSLEEKAAAAGSPFTAQEFIRRAKEGYYEAMRGFPDRRARRLWKRQFKYQMRMHVWRWKYNWSTYWAERAPLHPAMSVTLPVLSLIYAVAIVLWICAFVSVLATGTVLGLALPHDIPVWAAAFLLLIAYGVFVAPLKVARHVCLCGLGGKKGPWPFIVFLDAAIWLGVVAVLLCLAVHYFPQLHQAIHDAPWQAHQAIDSIRKWWKGQ